ncbi:hypothetical protein GS398_07710 [Pedobacter sp. HMF7056]|uniref:Uncharacterized protein n=2 Tax=Hufsiella ginkgonis TaxID=2695274 RepID=A0A7K1XW25_9SPHI|nr:DUF6607 family protein [Hufsiella ginkgonis]MXV15182.1 hypothetical protein [Hufsiella ginkgonis]
MFEQDNQKIVRSASGDKLLAREKGYEEFTKADEKEFAYAKSWWKEQQSYWATVRRAWDDVFAQKETVSLKSNLNGKVLFEKLFDLGDQSVKENVTQIKAAKKHVR